MLLDITSAEHIKRVGSVRIKQRIDFIGARDTNGLDGNGCLYTGLMSVIFIRILVIQTGLFAIQKRGIARIAYKNEGVLLLVNFPSGLWSQWASNLSLCSMPTLRR